MRYKKRNTKIMLPNDLDHVVTFRVSSEEREILEAVAEQNKTSQSKVLRELIRKSKPKRLPKGKKST